VNAYPYRLTTRRLLETLNSAYQEAAFTRQRHPAVAAAMSPDDLAGEGLADGDTVEIASAHGRLITRVKSDAALRPGTVSVPHMWGAQDAGARLPGEPFSGQLVSLDTRTQSINRTPVQTGLPVRVTRWAPAASQSAAAEAAQSLA
jgi:anaerobic selenocysteine-containing dehydrogenase